LHDGAPNVGTAWVQDAFSQAELVLESLKLATEFLVEGGTFVTKVFRSKDYNPLLWVFKQLFMSVEATKPPSSRNVSAEIFVVCRGYKAPKRIDPKFLDPKHVFAELADPTPNNEAKVFNPEKKKRKREGYEEGDWTQFKEVPVTEFINTTDPIAILGSCNKLSFQQQPGGDLALATLDRLPETTDEIRNCCEDLKVLGKKEFRNLLRWRLKVREKFGLVVKKGQAKDDEAEEVAEVAPMDDELAIQEELLRLKEKESARSKKERRKENERKRKEIVRMQMHMTTPMDIGMEQLGPGGEDATFSLKRAEKAGAAAAMASGKELAVIESESEESESETEYDDSDDEGDRLERELDSLYEQYQERKEDKDSKLRAKKARKDYEAEEWDGFSDSDKEGSDDEEDEAESKAPVVPTNGALSNNAALFFDQDIFQGLDVEDEEDEAEGTDNMTVENERDEQHEEEEQPKSKAATEKKKKVKETANTKPSEDSSDDEYEETDEPRKKNGQLGK
jgi:AdoMet-dependent rRNA methyltransferase SPB1